MNCGCGGPVTPTKAEGRKAPYKSVELEVPADFEMPTCGSCGAVFFGQGDGARLDAVLEPLYLKALADHLGKLRAKLRTFNITMKELEKACGVPRATLNNVFENPKEANPTLVALLELFALYPGELKTRIERASFDPSRLERAPDPQGVLMRVAPDSEESSSVEPETPKIQTHACPDCNGTGQYSESDISASGQYRGQVWYECHRCKGLGDAHDVTDEEIGKMHGYYF